MEWLKNNLRDYYHFIFAFGLVGLVFAATNFTNPPLFQNTDNFIFFAHEEIKLEQGVQVSSGDLGSNKELDIDKDAIINGNLFAYEIEIDKNTQINGNVSFNKLKIEKGTQILGSKTTPAKLPIASFPEIPEFQTGNQDFKFEGENNNLSPGSYRNIVLEKNSKLILTGGTYNLNQLELKENSTLIFSAPTTLNIQFKLKGQERVAILSGNNNLKPNDLVINYLGIRPKEEKAEKKDDDEKIESEMNDQEKKELKEKKIGHLVIFGPNSFLNFKLLAPKAKVQIDQNSTLRGQILGREVKVERGTVLSRKMDFEKESNLTKIVKVEGIRFIVNEIVILFKDETTDSDVQRVIDLVGGRIIGLIPIPKIYKIEVQTFTPADLNNKIQIVKDSNNPLIIGIVQNLINK